MDYVLNGKTYHTKEIDFLEMTKLEKCGISIKDLENVAEKPFGTILNCVCYITGLTPEQANKEITEHKKKGGTFEEIASCLNLLTESDFFK